MVAPTVTWLPGTVVRVADHDAAGTPGHDEIVRFAAPLDTVLTAEFDGALSSLRTTADVLLLAALGRAVERTLGAGVVSVGIADGNFAGSAVALRCVSARETHATAALLEADRTLALSSVHDAESVPVSEIVLSPAGTAALGLDADRALQVSAYRQDGVLQLDWCYDSRRFDAYTIVELAEQFPLALIELTSEAIGPLHGSATPATGWAFAG